MKVSVIIPTHNRPELLKKAVISVLNQTYQNFEIIVVDDGLKKRANEIVQNFNDIRIKYFQHQEEKGGSAARNTGIKNAIGDFIAFLDDDDEWLPEKLTVQMKEFEDSPGGIGFCFSAVTNFFDDRRENTKVPSGTGDYLEQALARAKTFLNVTLVVKKCVLDDVGFYDEGLPSHQESDLIIRIAKKFKGIGINKPLVKVNMLSDHESVGKSLKKGIVGRETILRKFSDEFEKRPKVLARKYFELGLLYRDSSQFVKAREIFRNTIRINFSALYFLHYLSMADNGAFYKVIRGRKLPKLKLVALIRTKNSEIVLDDSLTKLSELADEIILMDNGSTDGTLEICKKYPKIIKIICKNDTGNFHEGRDMNMLLDEAKKRYPDWITMAWPDEVFENHLSREDLDKYMHSGYDRIAFRMCNFWLSTKYCRYDRDWFMYTLRPQRFIWRNLEDTYFKDVVIHPGAVMGIDTDVYTSPFRIKHYGYAFKNEIAEKTRVFKSVDPVEKNKSGYESGDPESVMNRSNVLVYPFIEPKNGVVNYLYIIFFKYISELLLSAVDFKRKYLHRLKVFKISQG